MARITFEGYRCERCGHTWAPRQALDSEEKPPTPKVCPKCKSAWWDVPRKDKKPKKSGPKNRSGRAGASDRSNSPKPSEGT